MLIRRRSRRKEHGGGSASRVGESRSEARHCGESLTRSCEARDGGYFDQTRSLRRTIRPESHHIMYWRWSGGFGRWVSHRHHREHHQAPILLPGVVTVCLAIADPSRATQEHQWLILTFLHVRSFIFCIILYLTHSYLNIQIYYLIRLINI